MTDHFAVAALCRANPGEWQDVGEYNSMQAAARTVAAIETAYVHANRPNSGSAYSPAGTFEARSELTEFGARVETRYVGSDDDTWADALAAVTGGEAK